MTWCRMVMLDRVPAASPQFYPCDESTRYVVGCDLGQSADPTAIVVLQHVRGVMDGPQQSRAASRIERAHPGEGGAL